MGKWRNARTTARGRATTVATVAVAVALVVAGLAALVLQRSALVAAIDSALLARVDDVVALIDSGSVPSQLAVRGEDEALIQVVDDSGSVVAASSNIDGEAALLRVPAAAGEPRIESTQLPIGEGEFRTLVKTSAGGSFTVIGASSQEHVNEAVALLAGFLLVGIPALVAFVGVTVWVIIGRTLSPVESIRSEVASIGDGELHRRVPVPDTDDEIGRLAVTMNQMLSRLERAADEQRRFVADASHELRSPLAAIRSQLEVSQTHPGTADWNDTAGDVLDETLRMQRLVDDLLLLARSDSRAPTQSPVSVDLDDLVFEQVSRVSAGASATINTAAVSGAQVRGEETALGRLVRNLLENAVRYASTEVTVSLSEETDRAVLIVDDDGPGVAEPDRARAFDRFTRVDEARDRDHGGAGLGLAIVAEIVARHQGTVELAASPAGGLRVVVGFPLAHQHSE